MSSLLLKTDSYKISHPSQFPKGLSYIQYYIESRGGKYDEIMVSGIANLVNILEKGVSVEDVEYAKSLYDAHIGPGVFDYDSWMYVAKELGGKLQVRVKAIPEGAVVPVKTPLAIVESTNPIFAKLVGHLETLALRAVWYPTTVATESFEAKKIILKYLKKTTDDSVIPSVLPFRLHDFGARGASSSETVEIGGVAHLYNFLGSDSVEAIWKARTLYGESMAAFSIPAREHSTTTIYGKDGEDDAFMNSIEQWGKGLYACVMDSYDYEAALERITTGKLKEAIIAAGGTFVIRPDSGNPVDVVMAALKTVGKNVGYTINSKGYKVLHPSYRVIQGDGIDVEQIGRILSWMEANNWSAENVAFGMGGGLLQHMDRDTQKFAMKCCAAIVDGKPVKVFKSPKTDPGKASKAGFLDVVMQNGKYVTVSNDLPGVVNENSVLVTVFENGERKVNFNLAEIREQSNAEAEARVK